MIDPDDCEYFNWAPEDHEDLGNLYTQYDYTNVIPLDAKRNLFHSMSKTMGDFVLSDIFTTSMQMRWAMNMMKFGLQLPMEDIDSIEDAFKKYSDVFFVLNRLEFLDDDIDNSKSLDIIHRAMTELVCRPSTLFNPRCFFEDELPFRAIRRQYNNQVVQVRNSSVIARKVPQFKYRGNFELDPNKPTVPGTAERPDADNPSVLGANVPVEQYDQSPSVPAVDSPDTGMMSSPGYRAAMSAVPDSSRPQHHRRHSSGKMRPRADTSATVDTVTTGVSVTSTLAGDTHPTMTRTRMSGAVVLWNRYVQLLARVMQVYSTIIRTIQPNTPTEVVLAIADRLLLIVDMILSQQGQNPRLQKWVDKYRPHIGGELWDKTWGTIGDRLEYSAIKLAIDVWGRVISMPNVPNDVLLKDFRYWLHRENVLDAWLQMLKQVANRVLRAHYPHDTSIGATTMHVRIMDFSMAGTTSDEEAKALLRAYAGTYINMNAISEHSYCLYASHMCTIIENGLKIKTIVKVNGNYYVQRPPTANYILHYFGKPLLSIAWHTGKPSRYDAEARCRVIHLLAKLLALRVNPRDPIRTSYRNTLLSIIRREIDELDHIQAVLPAVALMLKNSRYTRPFIPSILRLICQAVPRTRDFIMVMSETEIRRHAYDALSALIAYSGYYHDLGCSDMLSDPEGRILEAFNNGVTKSKDESSYHHARNAMFDIIQKIENIPFQGSALDDAVFSSYLQIYFKILLCSVITETDTANMQYLTCVTLTYLHQYAQYNPGYVQIFVEFYAERYQTTRDDKLAVVYLYGLTQAAVVTWRDFLSDSHYRSIFTMLVHTLSGCDKNLRRYTHWNEYHQVFITSIRCLSAWLAVATKCSFLDSELTDELVNLLTRCNVFLRSSSPESPTATMRLGRKIQLTTSADASSTQWCPDFTAKLSNWTNRSGYQDGDLLGDDYIAAYSTLGVLSNNAPLRLSCNSRRESKHKVRVLSDSLYRVLSTTVSVFSTFLLRTIDKEQYVITSPPHDVLLMRMILYHNQIPDIDVLLNSCSPNVVHMLRDYKPVSIEFYSAYYRAIYSSINLKRYVDGKWVDAAILYTSRYPSGSKQWITFTTNLDTEAATDSAAAGDNLPSSNLDTDTNACPASNTTLPWVRMTESVISCGPLRSKFDILDMSGHIRHAQPIIDNVGERDMEERTADEFSRLHSARAEPDIGFARIKPLEFPSRGNNHTRNNLYDHMALDSSALNITESMLREIDHLDDLDRPFSAFAGVIYLRSPDSITRERVMAKGPIRGVSPEFNHFLTMLGRQNSVPVERLKRFPDDPVLMRYSFRERSFQVNYDLAPNVSSLISGCPMTQRDNEKFYRLLYERGIYVVWFDSHSGDLDHELAWQFLDNRYDIISSRQPESSSLPRAPPSVSERTVYSDITYNTTKSERPRPKRDPSVLEQTLRSVTVQPDYISAPHRTKRAYGSPKGSSKTSNVSEMSLHKFRAREFFQKAIGINRTHTSAEATQTLSRCSSDPNSTGGTDNLHHTQEASNNNRVQPSPKDRDLVGLEEALQMAIDVNPSDKAGAKNNTSRITEAASTPISPIQRAFRNGRTFSDSAGHCSAGNSEPNSPRSTVSDTASKIRVMIALAPIADTKGRLIKITMSASDGSKQMNEDFIRMTGPLMPNMVIETKDVAGLLSATVMDASSNIASLRGEDFTVVCKRVEMITSIIENFCARHRSAGDVHKFMFPCDTDEVTDLYAGDDLVSAASYDGKERSYAGASRCSTSHGPVLAGGVRDYDDCWSSLTIHEARNMSLDACMGYRAHLDSDANAGHKQTFERRTHELRRRARRRISDAFAKARNGWELLLLAFLQGRRTG
ncbi:hypothetical protein GGI15_004237, partial [Coemansia interrupta]